jgi:four helix bundle protein
MAVKTYRELVAWQKAMDLVEVVYRSTSGFPKEEIYGLTSQVRRAAVSVPSNIAEGQGRTSTRDFLNFLSIAAGSLCEMETQLLIAQRLHYLAATASTELLNRSAEVARVLHGLRRALIRK